MSEPMRCCRSVVRDDAGACVYCDRCDLLVGLEGLHVIAVAREPGGLVVTVESSPGLMGCPGCGVVAVARGRRVVRLVDCPAFGGPVVILWRKRRWRCPDPGCVVGDFVEQDDAVAPPRGLLTVRARWWAIEQIRAEHGSVNSLARQFGAAWRTVWTSIRPLLQAMADDPARMEGVTHLGVDEHTWHHVNPKTRGPKELTGMVDLTPDPVTGRPRTRLLDLVPGRSGRVYAGWLRERGRDFTTGI